MKFIILIIAIVAGYFIYQKMSAKPEVQAVQKTMEEMKKGDTAPVRYVNSLQNDVTKAQGAAAKDSAAIIQTNQAVDGAVKEGEQKPEGGQ